MKSFPHISSDIEIADIIRGPWKPKRALGCMNIEWEEIPNGARD